MVIECRKCGTNYRFDESLVTGEGIWVRCSRCHHVFFQEPSTGGETFASPQAGPLPLPTEEPKAGEIGETQADVEEESGEERAGFWTFRKLTVFLAVLVLIGGGIFFWLKPQEGKGLLENLPFWPPVAKYLGIETAPPMMNGGIDFVDVRENFVKNWVIGDVMVITGTAVNRNDYILSRIKVRAKLLDAQGQFIREVESFGGLVLPDDELAKLTEKEIGEKIALPVGGAIEPGGKIPFTIVFTNPPKAAVEFIVELASSERAAMK